MGSVVNRSRSKEINTWTQTAGIIVAAIWGIYTFGYKEIFIPNTAPVNISMDLQLQKVGISNKKKNRLIAVEMKVSATNPSSRGVKLLPSIWIAYGEKLVFIDENTLFNKKLNSALNIQNESFKQKHVESKFIATVAGGNLFLDDYLKPKETRTRTIIFHVPDKKYDVLEVKAIMPSGEDTGIVKLKWRFDENLKAPFLDYYPVDKKGNVGRSRITDHVKLKDLDENKIKLRNSISSSRLSLLQ